MDKSIDESLKLLDRFVEYLQKLKKNNIKLQEEVERLRNINKEALKKVSDIVQKVNTMRGNGGENING
ncbi:hypothetical protein J7L85_00710 [candidate division WOR-3 bacterium]|nr:hypothetical protein [candidate division WOR-3 bacterium]